MFHYRYVMLCRATTVPPGTFRLNACQSSSWTGLSGKWSGYANISTADAPFGGIAELPDWLC